jgi:site-specific DNA recombinase
MSERMRIVAIYERVSSDEQRENETIKTQIEVNDRYLATQTDAVVFARFQDNGVSGTVPMGLRAAGAKLLKAAMEQRFSELWVTRPNRLGRDEIDLLQTFALLQTLGITLVGTVEPIGDQFFFGINAVVSAADRRRFLALSGEGMARAAREGRYCGGIVPIGYRVEGTKKDARLVVSDIIMWRDWSESDLVRQLYRWFLEGWTAPKVAHKLNELGVPTAYQKDNREVRRGERKRRTDCIWRPGRILSIVKNPMYKGEYRYGRRSKKGREHIVASVPAIVSVEVWDMVQQALANNRIIPKNTERRYLLRSIMTCALCGLRYGAMWSHGELWYRCGGQTRYRASGRDRCPSKYIRARNFEPLVWADVERSLRDPSDLLDELRAESQDTAGAALREAEREIAEKGLASIPRQRNVILDAFRHEQINKAAFDEQMDAIASEEAGYKATLAELVEPDVPEENVCVDLLAELLRRLDEGLDEATQQEIIALMVKGIRIETTYLDGKKFGVAKIEYRFPGVVDTGTGRGSGRRPA